MTFSGNLAGIGLGDVFQNILGNRLSGTLILSVTGGQRFILFQEGIVTGFSFGVNKGLPIAAHLVQRQYVTEAQLERAKKRKAKQNSTLRTALQGMDLLDPDQFTAAAAELVEEQIYDLLSIQSAEFRFEAGKPPARVFDREQKSAGIAVDPSAILMEGARRVDEFSRIEQVVTDDRDIFVVLEGYDDYDLEEVQAAVAPRLDGRTDVGTLLQALPYSRFEVLKSINDLVRFDLARPLTGRELEQMAAEALASDEPEDAVALLRRALMIERSNTGLRVRLAELLQQVGQVTDAATEFAVLGYQEAQRGEIDRALDYYERAIELKPEDIGIHEKQVELLAENGHERHTESLFALGEKLADAGLLDKAFACLADARDLLSGDERVEIETRIAALEEQRGNGEAAAQIYRKLARQVAPVDAAAQLEYLRSAAAILRNDESLHWEIEDLESGRAANRRKRRRVLLRVAALIMITLGLGTMGTVELIASHQLIDGMQCLSDGRADATLRHLHDLRGTYPWTLAGLRAERIEKRVFEAELDRIEKHLAVGDPRSLVEAVGLLGLAHDEEQRVRVEVLVRRARAVFE